MRQVHSSHSTALLLPPPLDYPSQPVLTMTPAQTCCSSRIIRQIRSLRFSSIRRPPSCLQCPDRPSPRASTPGQSPSSANGPAFALASDPGAPYLFAANYTPTDTISAYAISGTTGALSLIGDYPAGGAYPRSVAVDPSGAYVYVANTDRIGDQCGPGTPSGNTITGFSIGVGGVLSPMGTFASGLAPQSLAITSVGNTEFLYSANYCSNDIGIYRINTGGALSLVGTTQKPANSGPHDLAVTPDGFLYVVNYMADTVDAYQIGTNGLLTALGTYPTSDNPAAVVVTP